VGVLAVPADELHNDIDRVGLDRLRQVSHTGRMEFEGPLISESHRIVIA
jgi:hypothetical protein